MKQGHAPIYFFFFLRAHPSSLKSDFSSLKNCCQSSFLPRALLYPRSSRLGFCFLLSVEAEVALAGLSLRGFVDADDFASLPL